MNPLELVAYLLLTTVVVTWLDVEYRVWRRAVRRRVRRVNAVTEDRR